MLRSHLAIARYMASNRDDCGEQCCVEDFSFSKSGPGGGGAKRADAKGLDRLRRIAAGEPENADDAVAASGGRSGGPGPAPEPPGGAVDAAAEAKRWAEAQGRLAPELALLVPLLRQLWELPHCWVFQQAVSMAEYPDYLRTVREPMDLGSVRRKLLTSRYSAARGGPEQFAADCRLTFANAAAYNEAGTDVHRWACAMLALFDLMWRGHCAGRHLAAKADAAAAAAAAAAKEQQRRAAGGDAKRVGRGGRSAGKGAGRGGRGAGRGGRGRGGAAVNSTAADGSAVTALGGEPSSLDLGGSNKRKAGDDGEGAPDAKGGRRAAGSGADTEGDSAGGAQLHGGGSGRSGGRLPRRDSEARGLSLVPSAASDLDSLAPGAAW